MKHTRTKPTVGEILIAVKPERRYREREELRAEVIKVGRKYFTCRMGGITKQFNIDTWRRSEPNAHANFPTYLYRTEQEMRDTEDHGKLSHDLSRELNYHSDWAKLSLAQLREIKRIIDTP